MGEKSAKKKKEAWNRYSQVGMRPPPDVAENHMCIRHAIFFFIVIYRSDMLNDFWK